MLRFLDDVLWSIQKSVFMFDRRLLPKKTASKSDEICFGFLAVEPDLTACSFAAELLPSGVEVVTPAVLLDGAYFHCLVSVIMYLRGDEWHGLTL